MRELMLDVAVVEAPVLEPEESSVEREGGRGLELELDDADAGCAGARRFISAKVVVNQISPADASPRLVSPPTHD